MTTYVIENDVRIPCRDPRGRPAKYPFSRMNVGDSVHIEGGGKRPGVAAQQYGYRNRMAFSYRTTETGVRVWRIA